MQLTLQSSAFADNSEIPKKFGCQGEDISPPLSWQNTHSQTKSYVLIVDDPDAPAGTWVHWVLFNISPDINNLDENATAQNAISGKNSWGTQGYRGPCPPSGTHRYFFKIYALDQKLNLSDNADKKEVIKVMEGHVLGKAELMGFYSAKQN